MAAELVARGEAAALFSAGHTGATVMAAHGAFGMLPGVDRPALAATIPTRRRPGGPARRRRERRVPAAAPAAVRGDGQRVRARRARHRVAARRPAVDRRGRDQGQRADARGAPAAQGAPLAFIGNIEARDVYSGEADVIVCDGFTGNVALKISEGLVEMVEDLLREELSSTLTMRVGSLLTRRALRRFRRRVDYSEYGGAPLLGVAGVAIVGHGRSSAKAVRNAVAMAYRFAADRFIERVEQRHRRRRRCPHQ